MNRKISENAWHRNLYVDNLCRKENAHDIEKWKDSKENLCYTYTIFPVTL
jgi:hypothetical protein